MTRRRFSFLPRRPQLRPRVVTWESEDCPGCGRLVLFLPGQDRNTCAWCETVVVSRGVE